MPNRRSKPTVILLVEDDPGDQELTRRALENDVFKADLRIVSDGEEALEYLYRRGAHHDAALAPRPDLILLDLNMPKLDGRAVLARIKTDPQLRRIAVVVLTTSQQESEIIRSYDLGCNSFITKPVDFEKFIATIRGLGAYWFQFVTLSPA